jgi:hypothetical protein
MRRFLRLGIVFVVVALAFVVWARSGVVETSADVVRSPAGISPYDIMTGSKNLPVQHVDDPL